MEQVSVKINVDEAEAVRNGTSQHGMDIVTLSDADVASLTPEEREVILAAPAVYVDGLDRRAHELWYLRIDYQDYLIKVASGGIEGVRQAIARIPEVRAEAEREQQQKIQRQRAEYEAALATVLDAPVSELIITDRLADGWQRSRSVSEVSEDPRAAEKISEIDSEIERRREVYRRERAEREAAEEFVLHRHHDIEEEFRSWVLASHAGVAAKRAAGDDYDVRTAVIAAVVQSVVDRLGYPQTRTVDASDVEWEERGSPTVDALDFRSKALDTINAIARPTCVTLDLSRISRITYSVEDDFSDSVEELTVTGVVVSVRSPLTDTRYLVYSAE